jgi:hypothetical protein
MIRQPAGLEEVLLIVEASFQYSMKVERMCAAEEIESVSRIRWGKMRLLRSFVVSQNV